MDSVIDPGMTDVQLVAVEAPPAPDRRLCRCAFLHSGLLTFLRGMLAPLGLVITAMI